MSKITQLMLAITAASHIIIDLLPCGHCDGMRRGSGPRWREICMKFDSDHVARALRLSWSPETARQWTAENPAAGQCNVTALLVHELFGGELLMLLCRRVSTSTTESLLAA